MRWTVLSNKSLNFIVNQHFKLNKSCIIRCWNEKTVKWDKIEIQELPNQEEFELKLELSVNESELIDILWEAGLLKTETDQQILDWIEQKRTENLAPIAIAFDTNLILRGYLRNLLEKIVKPVK